MKNTLLPCLLLLTFHPLPAQVPYTYVVQVLPGLQSGSISVSHSPLDNGTIENAFDGNANSLARSASRTFRVMLAKITADGQQTFLKELETGLPAIDFKIVAAGDGNLFIAGYSYRPGQENSDLLVLKCSPDGTVLWEKNWGTELNDRAYSLLALADGGSSDASDRSVHMLALRLDAKGELLAANTALADAGTGYRFDMLLTQSCRTRCMARNSAGDFMLGGNVQNARAYGVFLTKFSGRDASAAGKNVDQTLFMLFPNPFTEFTYLKIGEPFQSKVLTISSLDGKEVRRTHFDDADICIYREQLPVGTCCYSVRDNRGQLMTSGRLVVQ